MGHPLTQPRRRTDYDTAAAGLARGDGLLRVAIHFDVDTVDSNEIVLGLGAEPNGLTSAQVRRVVNDLDASTDVGLTIAEFFRWLVMHLQRILTFFPLLRTGNEG